jgi:hypothetical protein
MHAHGNYDGLDRAKQGIGAEGVGGDGMGG